MDDFSSIAHFQEKAVDLYIRDQKWDTSAFINLVVNPQLTVVEQCISVVGDDLIKLIVTQE